MEKRKLLLQGVLGSIFFPSNLAAIQLLYRINNKPVGAKAEKHLTVLTLANFADFDKILYQ